MIHIASNFAARHLAPCHFGFSPVSLAGPWSCRDTELPSSKKKAAAQQSRMIRVPLALHKRLARIAREFLTAKERGQGFDDVALAEQGQKGVWVPLHAVIERALDEFESHRMRSNPRSTQRKPKRK